MEIILALKTVSEANSKEHWSQQHRRHKKQKHLTAFAFLEHRPPKSLPCTITLTRIAPRFLDSDNLVSSFKYIRDAIADYLIPGKKPGFADSNDQIKWVYLQEKGKPKEYAIKINFS